MTSHATTLAEVLDYLKQVGESQIQPAEAAARLRLLQRRHADTRMELLWQEERYDGSIHYDVLLRTDDQGTTSLSYCPDRAQPWPLRGVQRWSDQDVLRVNATRLQVSQAVACLDFIWDHAPIIDRLVNVCLIQEELEREPIELSTAELQRAMDGFRRAHRLYTAGETRSWLERRGISHAELEELVGDEAVVAKLRQSVTEGRVEAYFEAHQSDFETAHIARLALSTEAEAAEASHLIRSARLDFYALAEQRFVASSHDDQVRMTFDVVQRRGMSDALADAILNAAPGDVVGPVVDGDAHVLALILSRGPAQLDARTRAAVERVLFDQWLAERRSRADIEWFWWNAARTASPLQAAA